MLKLRDKFRQLKLTVRSLDRTKILAPGGAYGTVFEGQWRGIPVAVKRVPNNLTKERKKSTLLKLNHRNVIKLFHINSDEHFKHYVLELCEASLDRLFLKDGDPRKYRGPMPPEYEIIKQLAEGLEYIHQMKLIHRDIKPENVLIWVNPSQIDQVLMKWSGLETSKLVNETGTCSMSGIKGTYNWLAPETIKLLKEEDANFVQQTWTIQSDVFAEGLVFGYYLLGGRHLYGSRYQIQYNIIKNAPVNLPKIQVKPAVRALIEKMLTANPEDRITSSDVVQQLENIGRGPFKDDEVVGIIRCSLFDDRPPPEKSNEIKLDKETILGNGDYGDVFLGEWNSKRVAVKQIKLSEMKTQKQEDELTLLRLDHPNVVKLLHVEDDSAYRNYAMELCAASLDQLFSKNDDHSKYLESMPSAEDVLYQLAIGLYYIHETGLIHRDIKPQNVFIWTNPTTKEVVMKWGGLRLSKGNDDIKNRNLTFGWLAPELLKTLDKGESDTLPTVKSDVFAQGLVFGYYLLRGEHLFGCPVKAASNIMANEPVNLHRFENQATQDLIKKMLEPNPEKRMTSSDVAEVLEQIRAKEMVTTMADDNTPSLKQIKINVNKILGSGGYGTVFQGEWNYNQVAVKQIPLSKVESNQREEEALQMLNHPNVIKLFHTESDSENRYYAIELCAASLDEFFANEKEPKKYQGPMPPDSKVLLQLAEGLQYIHEKSLIHRDIKPQNVLIHVDSTGKNVLMKWADFGLSKSVNENGSYSLSKNVKGSDKWFPPEILKLMDDEEANLTECQAKQRGTIKSDVFNQGLIFGYYLLKGRHLFGNLTESNIYRDKPVNLDKIQWEIGRELIKKMIRADPKERISSSDVAKDLRDIKSDLG